MKVEAGLSIDKIFAEPSLLYNTGLRLEKQGYIGDLENKLAVYLAGTTKDYSKDDRISIIAKAQSGAGKSTVGNILERYFEDVYAFHRMTAHAADYWADEIETLDGKILIIKQMEGSEQSQYTVEIMVDPISGGLKLLTVSGTPGQKKTEVISLPGMLVMLSTTTAVNLDSQLLRRFYTIYPSDSPEQTKNIMEHKGKMREDLDYEAQVRTTDEILKQIPLKLKEGSARYRVIIPFATKIAEKIPKVLLARSDIDKIYSYVSAITHLYYKQRLFYKDIEGDWRIIASPIDYYYAWQIVKVSIPKRLGGISDDRTYRIFQIMQRLILKDKNPIMTMKDIMQAILEEEINYARNTVYQTVGELIDQGYVHSEKNTVGDKRKNLYSMTSKAYVPFGITFPDEDIESKYLKFIAEQFGKQLSTERWELLRKSMIAVDLEEGTKITDKVVSEKTREMLKL